MAPRETDEASQTVTRKPDDAVGSPGSPPAGGGHQTPEQAAITDQGGGGLGSSERKDTRPDAGEPGRSPPVPGGSSNGHSDQKPSRGPGEDRKTAGGLYKAEREA